MNLSTNDPQDALNRDEYCNGIVKLIKAIPKGVVAIDGEWGVGKSWFGKRIHDSLLSDEGIKKIWIDAFASSWDEDPLITLISELAAKLEPEKEKEFIGKVVPLLGKALPVMLKTVARVTGNAVGVNSEVIDAVSDVVKDDAEAYLQQRIEDVANRKRSLQQLRQVLSEAVAGDGDKKIVVFVDELDRCSPSFAVGLLERMHHIFDLDKVVYVLLWNRRQMQNTVKSFYGQDTDGMMYLDKFVDYPFNLPRGYYRAEGQAMNVLLNQLIGEYKGRNQLLISDNKKMFLLISEILKLNARETKRLASWWVISALRRFTFLETWLLGLKVKHPSVYSGICSSENSAHDEAEKLLIQASENHENSRTDIQLLAELHRRMVSKKFDNASDEFNHTFGDSVNHPKDCIKSAIRRIEYTID